MERLEAKRNVCLARLQLLDARIALQRLKKQPADAADERSPRAQATAPSTAAGALHAEPLVAKRSASQATGTAAAVLNPGVLARRGARTAAGSTGAAEAFSSANVPIDVATGGAGMEGGPPSQIWPASCEAQDSKVAGAKEAPSSKAWPVQHAALKHAAEWPRAAGGAVMEKERPSAHAADFAAGVEQERPSAHAADFARRPAMDEDCTGHGDEWEELSSQEDWLVEQCALWLGVPLNAPQQVWCQKYKALCLRIHPDKQQGEHDRSEATVSFQRLQVAWGAAKTWHQMRQRIWEEHFSTEDDFNVAMDAAQEHGAEQRARARLFGC
jgi:hypothetical protein